MRTAVTLALLGTLLYPACSTTATANAPQRFTPVPKLSEQTLPPGYQRVVVGPHTAGTTICTTGPMSWVREEMGDVKQEVIRAHEADHRDLMRQFPDCASYWRWRDSSHENGVTAEARAFCAAAKKAVEIGRNPTLEAAVWQEAWDFLWYFGMSQAEAAASIQAHGCAGPDPSPPTGP